jgi:hypothetical protein
MAMGRTPHADCGNAGQLELCLDIGRARPDAYRRRHDHTDGFGGGDRARDVLPV